jgi:hypothetical protein
MSFVQWMMEGLYHWTIYVQIANDTGWLASQTERMPYMMNQLHAKIVTFISDDKDKK